MGKFNINYRFKTIKEKIITGTATSKEELYYVINEIRYDLEEATLSGTVEGSLYYNAYGLFEYCDNLTTADLSKLDVSNVTSMNSMFKCCKSLTTLDVSNWNVSNVKNMNSMFYGCDKLKTLDLSKWDTKNIVSVCEMFTRCGSTYKTETKIVNKEEE